MEVEPWKVFGVPENGGTQWLDDLQGKTPIYKWMKWWIYKGKSIYKWMITRGIYPHLWKPPCVVSVETVILPAIFCGA